MLHYWTTKNEDFVDSFAQLLHILTITETVGEYWIEGTLANKILKDKFNLKENPSQEKWFELIDELKEDDFKSLVVELHKLETFDYEIFEY